MTPLYVHPTLWPAVLLVLLSYFVKCSAPQTTTYTRRSELYSLNQDFAAIPQGASSLAFVFDITGSMHNDLVQVIEGAAKILATTLARREKPLYNYVLVPFHDPSKFTLL
ncbi:hypothetical protein LSH36_299g00049 [Paralvinella palmiformis]|uniref:Hemicentin-1-like von Willebrand factor A domain-containing protein n=1 Tax=Paralvinella palmiformis TaxID=53620 RepID=A0AAD9JJ27_9ANNE|nr:hypothetical protein LSH36_299g00049 [Paralvinella palmiformis]